MAFLGLSSSIVGEVSKTVSGWVQNPFNRNFFYWYFFPALARVHPKHHTPGVSIIVLNLWACLLVLSGKYDDLFNLVIFASWILYGMTAAAVLVLRHKQPGLVRPYRTLGYPVVPLLFLVGAGILLFSTAFKRPRESAMGLAISPTYNPAW